MLWAHHKLTGTGGDITAELFYNSTFKWAAVFIVGVDPNDYNDRWHAIGCLSKPSTGGGYVQLGFTNSNAKLWDNVGNTTHFVYYNEAGVLAIRNATGATFQYTGLVVFGP